MGKIYARLIHKHITLGIDTGYAFISDVPGKYQASTKTAYKQLYGVVCPDGKTTD